MPSGPNLFDDEDGLDTGDRSTPPEPAPDLDAPTSHPGRRRTPPNYLIRRAVVVGGVVAVLATASIVIGQLMSSGSDDAESGAIGADWNRIVLVDERTGRVVVDDADGEELARIESGIRSPNDSAIVASSLVVANDQSVAVVAIGDERVDEYELGADVIVNPAGSALAMIAPRPDGGRAILVHGPSGDVIDTDSFAPVVGARYDFAESRSSTSGRDILVTDAGNFQSVLFSFDRQEPSYFPGLALAVDADLVVTAQNVGSDATVSVFDHTGEQISTGRTPSVRAGMITDAGVVLVTVEGEIVIMSRSDGDVSDSGSIDVGTVESGDVATSGDRLVVTGTSGAAVIDASAEVLTVLDGQRAIGDEPPTGSTCVGTVTTETTSASESGDSDDGADLTQVSLIDLTDGSVLVEAAASEPVVTDASGCRAAAITSEGFDVFDTEGVREFTDGDTVLAMSLDGADVIAERSARLVLLDVSADSGDDAEQEPIDLGPRGRTVHFTQS